VTRRRNLGAPTTGIAGLGLLLEATLPPGAYRIYLHSFDSSGRSDSTALEHGTEYDFEARGRTWSIDYVSTLEGDEYEIELVVR
jgi:hypothetical protein